MPSFAVVVLDANDHLGGRVSQVEGLAPWPIQLGPELSTATRTTR